MKCIFPHHQKSQIIGLCRIPQCHYSSRLCCQQCIAKDHQKHQQDIISLSDIMSEVKISERLRNLNLLSSSPLKSICSFLQENLSICKSPEKLSKLQKDVDSQIEKIFKLLEEEILRKIQKLEKFVKEACRHKMDCMVKKLKDFQNIFDEQVNLKQVKSTLQQYEEEIINHANLKLKLNEYFQQQSNHDNLIQLYNNFTKEGVNHNYIDVFDFDLNFFENQKNQILAQLADHEKFLNLIPDYKLKTDQIEVSQCNKLNLHQICQRKDTSTQQYDYSQIKKIEYYGDNQFIILLNKKVVRIYNKQNGQFLSELPSLQNPQHQIDNFLVLRNNSCIPSDSNSVSSIVTLNSTNLANVNTNYILVYDPVNFKLIKSFQLKNHQAKIKESQLMKVQNVKNNKYLPHLLTLDEEGILIITNMFTGQEVNAIATQSQSFSSFWEQSHVESMFENQLVSEFLVTAPKKKFVEIRNPLTNTLVMKYKIEKELDKEIFYSGNNFQVQVIKISEFEKSEFKNFYGQKHRISNILTIMNNDQMFIVNWNSGQIIKKVQLWQDFLEFRYMQIAQGSFIKTIIVLIGENRNKIKTYELVGGAQENYELQNEFRDIFIQKQQTITQNKILFISQNDIIGNIQII